MNAQRDAQIAHRVTASFLSRPPAKIVYLAKPIGLVEKALGGVDSHGKKLVKAQKLLQPLAAEAPKKPIGKTYAKLEAAVGQLRALRKAGKEALIQLYRAERLAQAEVDRVIKVYMDVPEYFDFDLDEVHVPNSPLRYLESVVDRFNAIVEDNFKDSFAVAGGDDKALKSYESLIKSFDWKAMLIPKLDIDPGELQSDMGEKIRDDIE